MLYLLLLLPVMVCMAEMTAVARLPCPSTIHHAKIVISAVSEAGPGAITRRQIIIIKRNKQTDVLTPLFGLLAIQSNQPLCPAYQHQHQHQHQIGTINEFVFKGQELTREG